MVLAVVCPVCSGEGQYIPPPGEGPKRSCHGCEGKGWVQVDTGDSSVLFDSSREPLRFYAADSTSYTVYGRCGQYRPLRIRHTPDSLTITQDEA